jgi:hypothetical protein
MKLTKTEQTILNDLAARGRICVSDCWGTGPDGGRVASGARAVKAAFSLRDKGLVEVVKIDRETHTQRGRSIFSRDVILKLA